MMNSWAKIKDGSPIGWLLEPANPAVRAKTMTDLLDMNPGSPEVIAAKQAMATCNDFMALLADQQPAGYWGKPEHYFRKNTGTAWRWLMLHELGFDPQHPQMQKAAHFLLDITTLEEGGFRSHVEGGPVPCYNGWLLWGYMRSGLGEDPRVQAGLRWIVEKMWYADGDDTVADPDNGCWGRHTCYRGVVPIVKALVALPEKYRSAETDRALKEGLNFILAHRVYKRSHDLAKPMNAKLTQLTFPCLYWPDLVEVLLILTQGGIRDPRMDDSITYLQKKQGKDGTWKLQRTYNERSKHDTFPVVVPLEARGAPSKWVTLRALTVLKRVLS